MSAQVERLLRAAVAADEHDGNAEALFALGQDEAAAQAVRLSSRAASRAGRLRDALTYRSPIPEPRGPQLDLTDPRPVLYVDVDGVLNAFEDLDHDGESFRANGYLIRVPDGIRERIAHLGEHFQMAWGTMWEHDAPEYLSPVLGFGDDWPVADRFSRFARPGEGMPLGVKLSDALGEDRTWKLTGLLEHAATHTLPFAWLDDDLEADAYAAFEQINAQGRPCMLAHTDAAFGLDDEVTGTLIAWAASLASREALPQAA